MANLTKQTIQDLVKLSCIECSDEEQDKLLIDLEKIISYMEHLEEVDTTGVAPCNHVLASVVNVIREDKVGLSLSRELFLSNAPSQIGGMVRVPPVIKSS